MILQGVDEFHFILDDVMVGQIALDASVKGPHAGVMQNVRRLAREGVILRNFQHPDRICSGSRASNKTGRMAVTWGMHSTVGTGRNAVDMIPPHVPTIFELAQGVGYECAHIGKNHTGTVFPGVFSYNWANPPGVPNPPELAAPKGGTDPIMRDTLCGSKFVEWYDGAPADKPRLGYAELHAPHYENRPTPESEATLPASIQGSGRKFWGSINQADDAIGVMMQRVRASGRPTIVYFYADNSGHYVNTSDLDDGAPPISTPFRGTKNEVGRGSTTSPALVWGQNVGEMIGVGTSTDAYISALDIVPMFCARNGITPPDILHGEDMTTALSGGTPQRAKPLYWLTTSPDRATLPSYHDFPRVGMLDEGMGVRAYCQPDGSNLQIYSLSDQSETFGYSAALGLGQPPPSADLAQITFQMGEFVQECRSAGCPI